MEEERKEIRRKQSKINRDFKSKVYYNNLTSCLYQSRQIKNHRTNRGHYNNYNKRSLSPDSLRRIKEAADKEGLHKFN